MKPTMTKMKSRIFQGQQSLLDVGTSWTSTASNTLVVNSGDALSFQ